MRRIKIIVEYDGTSFAGWQRQKNGRSIQGEIEKALFKRFHEKRTVVGAGRTDQGVHALNQAAHFDLKHPIEVSCLRQALNTALPPAIVIRSAEEVKRDFHARHDAVSRWYRYTIHHAPYPPALDRHKHLWVPYRLNISRMRVAAGYLEGTHDFTSFASGRSEIRRPRRRIDRISVKSRKPHITIDVISRAFLRQMIRIIAGTLLEAGAGKRAPEDIPRILRQKNRRAAGPTAGPEGLCLMQVDYPSL